MLHLNFDGDTEMFKGQVRKAGYVVTRMVTRHNNPQRTWKQGDVKATTDQVAYIDNLLSQDHLTMQHIVRIMRLHGMKHVQSVIELENAMMRAGYAWRWTIISIDTERGQRALESNESQQLPTV